MRPPRGRGFGGRDGGRGGGGGRGFGGGRGGRGFGGGGYDQGPPESVVEAGAFSHPCEGEAVCKLTNDKVRCALCRGRGGVVGEAGQRAATPKELGSESIYLPHCFRFLPPPAPVTDHPLSIIATSPSTGALLQRPHLP